MQRLLFLTSTGLPIETRNYFLELLPQKPEKLKVVFIPTAADPEKDKWFVKASRDELLKLKFKVGDVDLKENPEEIKKKLEASDIIYINGGNTFYLLDWVRKSGLDKYLEKLINEGKIYIGCSAGSILVGPNIEVSGFSVEWDKNIVSLKNLTGLNLVPFAISPHFTEKERELLARKSKNLNYPIIAISDQQAVLVQGNNWKVIGGEKLSYFGIDSGLRPE